MKYENITKYLEEIEKDNIGTLIIDKKSAGTLDDPFQMPFVNYTEFVHSFIEDVYRFIDNNEEMELTNYGEILNENGIEWGSESMKKVDVSVLNAKCILALIVGAVRAERFCDGALLNFFKDGCIRKWLIRLKEIDCEVE